MNYDRNTLRARAAMPCGARAHLGHWVQGTLALLATLVIGVCIAAPARAAFGVEAFDGQVTANAAGDPFTQAGGHPYSAWTAIKYNSHLDPFFGSQQFPDADARHVLVDLPSGLVGNPTVVPKCALDEFFSILGRSGCDPETQIGVVELRLSEFPIPVGYLSLYNMEPGPGDLAQFAFKVSSVPVFLTARLRMDGSYGLSIDSRNSSQGVKYDGIKVELWGNPADPVYDQFRCQVPDDDGTCTGSPGDPNNGPNSVDYTPVPVLTNPTACTPDAEGLVTKLRTDSWQSPGVYHEASFESHLPPAYPAPEGDWGPAQGPTGCEDVPFDPSARVVSDSRRAGGPAGVGVDLAFPQDGLTEPGGIATAHLRRVEVRLPDGMVVNPSSANGLAACSDAQMGFGDDEPVGCPQASRIGSAWATTPLLEERIEGALYLGSQRSGDPQSGEMFRLFLLLEQEQRGLRVKLRGQVRVDPQTGAVTAVFANNPQLPVGEIHVQTNGGDRAPLTNPDRCGTKTTTTSLTPWSTDAAELRDSFFALDEGCGRADSFDPGFVAGTESPVAGSHSPFRLRVQRDAGKDLGRVDVSMPEGLVAELRHVELCTDAQVAAASGRGGRSAQGAPGCPVASQIGTTTVGAGSGTLYYPSLPNSDVSGRVFLTEGYKGAPYGLAIEVPAVAGPFDLGTVMVRAAVHVDPDTARLSVVSDRLPWILKGVPLDVRDVRVDIDRERFTVNPTSCREQQVGGTITAQDGTGVRRSSRFQVGDCRSLGFRPRMRMRLIGRKQRRTGGNPALAAVLRQGDGQANIDRARVVLPRSIALDAENSSDPQLLCDWDAARERAQCPESTVIGHAKADTPLLKEPLRGPVHMVQGIKIDEETGNRIRTTPELLVKLDGEVQINVRAKTTSKNGLLITRFLRVPDARVSRFRLRLKGGPKTGILTVTRTRQGRIDLCDGRQIARVRTKGHNNAKARFKTRVRTPCGKPAKKRAAAGKRAAARKRAARARRR